MSLDLPLIHKRLCRWYQINARPLPWRVLWAKHRNPWHVWVSEIMLQQTVIKAVLPVYSRFLTQFPDPETLASADSESVRLAVRGLGYYRRFDLLHRSAKHLCDKLAGVWPQDFDAWKSLPGIGDYTASAIASITLDLPHGVVDGNVERVLCRLLDIRTAPNLPKLKARFKQLMDQLVAEGSPGLFNQSMMELGQTVCTPASPACQECPLSSQCAAFKNKSQDLAPGPKAKLGSKNVELALIVPTWRQRIGLVRRPPVAKFLKGTLGFATLIQNADNQWQGDGFDAPAWMLEAASTATSKRFIKHTITNHKIRARIITVETQTYDLIESRVSVTALEESLVSNLDRKASTHLLPI